MKILLVEPFGRRISHAPQYVRDTSLALTEAGIQVTIVTFEGVAGAWINRDKRIKHSSVVSQAGIRASMAKSTSSFLRTAPFFRMFNLAFDTFLTYNLASKINKKEKQDIIHLLDSSMPLLSFLIFASTQKSANLVFTLHSSIDALRDNALEKLKFTNTLKNHLYRRAIKRKNSIGFICFSNVVHESFRSTTFYDKIHVVPNPRPLPKLFSKDEARKHLGLQQEAKILLCFGINHNSKDYEVIFKAAQSLSIDFKLLFAGKINYADEKRDPRLLAEKYSLEKNTLIVNEYIPEEEVPYYFCAADAVILAYNKSFVAHASSLLDAAQYNLPVIAINTGSTGEDVEAWNMGVTFTPEDPDSLRAAILSFFSHSKDERESISRGLASFASTISWEQAAKSHIKLYKMLVEEVHEP